MSVLPIQYAPFPLPAMGPAHGVIPSPSGTEVIKKVALSCLKDLAASLVLGAVVACFVPTPVGITLLIYSIAIQFTVNTFFQMLGGFSAYKAAQKGPYEAQFERTANLCEWMTGVNFALFTGLNAQTLIHESGHALATLAVYRRPRPRIEVMPFIGGLTKYFKTPLTPFGKKLGAVGSTILVVACGPGFTLLISSILLVVGLSIKDKHPQLGKALISWSFFDFLNHAHYAYSATWASPTNLAHDFVHLAIFGLHPVVATIGIIAIPIVITVGFHCWKSRQPQPVQPAPVLV